MKNKESKENQENQENIENSKNNAEEHHESNIEDNEKSESVSEAEDALESLTRENVKLNDLLLRSKAENDNLQKRTLKQIQQAQLYSTEKLSSELLMIMDSLEAANNLSEDPNLKLESLIEGNSLLLKTTKEVFEKLGIEEIYPLNDDFDPESHQAMATKESEADENKVLEVMQKGYKLKSKLLRPALVIVSKKSK
ncbi:MAG: nucleotide exchange factor GrpE [Gammaproteobacteria bacterium]|nr:nucleotide exchange factor GrpE [Gammaproteobacteria bacterium]|tara:strand:+ start:5643 stop:6230 length:588 start_codon:yes stop_codon:yes gene_type:complete